MRVQVACVIVESFFSCVTIKRTQAIGSFASSHYYYCLLKICIHETLPNLIKGKHPRKGEKKGGRGARTKVQASKQPKRDLYWVLYILEYPTY